MPRSQLIRHRRLISQRIARPAGSAADTVACLGAVQAQDYLASLWAVGLRARRATASTIEQAIADGSIVRTHVSDHRDTVVNGRATGPDPRRQRACSRSTPTSFGARVGGAALAS
jgi:hypothetical protein